MPDTPGDVDLHLFNEGTHRRLWELLGPQRAATGIRFAVWAPAARAVAIIGDFNAWQPTLMTPVASSGIWSIVVAEATPGQHYKFVVTGSHGRDVMKADPMARRTECPPGDASVVPDDDAPFAWSDDEWMLQRHRHLDGSASMRIYEVHLGSWRRDLTTWDDVATALANHVQDLGFTHVEFLPLAEHPFGGANVSPSPAR